MMSTWPCWAPHSSRPADKKVTILAVVTDFDHYEEVELLLYKEAESSVAEPLEIYYAVLRDLKSVLTLKRSESNRGTVPKAQSLEV